MHFDHPTVSTCFLFMILYMASSRIGLNPLKMERKSNIIAGCLKEIKTTVNHDCIRSESISGLVWSVGSQMLHTPVLAAVRKGHVDEVTLSATARTSFLPQCFAPACLAATLLTQHKIFPPFLFPNNLYYSEEFCICISHYLLPFLRGLVEAHLIVKYTFYQTMNCMEMVSCK